MHFTYDDSPDSSQLYQGDVIFRNETIDDKILKEVHPHYQKGDYKAFIVLTQTCDLARRNGGTCGVRYISIAAIRPLKLVLDRFLEGLCKNDWEFKYRITNDRNREKMRLFLERLFNNNEDEYFFLFKEPSVGLSDDCCAFLQLSIAVKADFHYETLLQQKKLQLRDTFQHKLGSLVGKMYSRVGTPDWVPTHYQNESDFAHHINSLIGTADFASWLDNETYRELAQKINANAGQALSSERLNTLVDEIQASRKRRQADFLAATTKSFTDVGVNEAVIRRALARLQSESTFKSLFAK